MLLHLPGPVAARVEVIEGPHVIFRLRDAAHAAAFAELLEKARQGGYAISLSLLHYEGCPDTAAQAVRRAARKAGGLAEAE